MEYGQIWLRITQIAGDLDANRSSRMLPDYSGVINLEILTLSSGFQEPLYVCF